MIPPDAGGAPTCGSWSSPAAAAGVLSNPVSKSDGNPAACLMGAQLSAATGRSSDSSAACASAKKSRARKLGRAAARGGSVMRAQVAKTHEGAARLTPNICRQYSSLLVLL